MIKKSLTPAFACVALAIFSTLCAAQQASAATVFTCTGGYLYVDVQLADGTWWCYQTTQKCAGGEWSVEVARQVRIPENPGITYPGNVSQRIAAEVLRLAGSLRQENVRLYYRAPDSMQKSFLRRSGLAPQGTVGIFERKLARWPAKAMTTGTFTSGNAMQAKCPEGLYPNGDKCYPCLGCEPCPPDYCSTVGKTLTVADIPPKLARAGYTIKQGKMVPPPKRRVEPYGPRQR